MQDLRKLCYMTSSVHLKLGITIRLNCDKAPSSITVGALPKASRCFTTDLESLLCSMNPSITNSIIIPSFLEPMGSASGICLRWYFPATLTPPINRTRLYFAHRASRRSLSTTYYIPSDSKTYTHFSRPYRPFHPEYNLRMQVLLCLGLAFFGSTVHGQNFDVPSIWRVESLHFKCRGPWC